MNTINILLARISLTALLAALLAGCTGRQGPARAVVIYPGGPITSDPHFHREVETRSIQFNIYEGLVGFDRGMEIVPLLAERWENPDVLTWRFTIRQGVRFSGGRELTAADAASSLVRAWRHPQSQIQGLLESVDTIIETGRSQLEIRTDQPDPLLLKRLTKVAIISGGQLTVDSDSGGTAVPEGTGPYVCEYWGRDSLILGRNGHYWGQNKGPGRIRYLFIPDRNLAVEMLKDGQADIVADVPPQLAAEIQDRGTVKLIRKLGLVVRYLRLDPRFRAFRSRDVRRAISLALDRDQLLASVLRGYGISANQMVSPTVFGFNPDMGPQIVDTAQSRRLLAKAGYSKGLVLDLDLTESKKEVGLLIAGQLDAVGIRVRLRPRTRTVFFGGTERSYFLFSGLAATSGDASDIIGEYVPLTGDDVKNLRSLDTHIRLGALQRMMLSISADCFYIPLYIEEDLYGISERVDWQPRLDMMILGKEMIIRAGSGRQPEIR